MAKLEWVPTGSGRWACGLHRIHVRADGMFVAYYGESRAECCKTLSEAQDWCQAQEDAAQSQTPMPKAGEVWGDPAKPETWRKVNIAFPASVTWENFDECWSEDARWGEWLRKINAVNITALLQEAEQTREKLAKAVEGLRWIVEQKSSPHRLLQIKAQETLEQIGSLTPDNF